MHLFMSTLLLRYMYTCVNIDVLCLFVSVYEDVRVPDRIMDKCDNERRNDKKTGTYYILSCLYDSMVENNRKLQGMCLLEYNVCSIMYSGVKKCWPPS